MNESLNHRIIESSYHQARHSFEWNPEVVLFRHFFVLDTAFQHARLIHSHGEALLIVHSLDCNRSTSSSMHTSHAGLCAASGERMYRVFDTYGD